MAEPGSRDSIWNTNVAVYLSETQKRNLPEDRETFGIKGCLHNLKKGRNDIAHMPAGSPILNSPRIHSENKLSFSLQAWADNPDRIVIDYHDGNPLQMVGSLPGRINTREGSGFKIFPINIDIYHGFFLPPKPYLWQLTKNAFIICGTDTGTLASQQADIRLDLLDQPESLIWESPAVGGIGATLNMIRFSRNQVALIRDGMDWYLEKIESTSAPVFIHAGGDAWTRLRDAPGGRQKLNPGDSFIAGHYMLCLK